MFITNLNYPFIIYWPFTILWVYDYNLFKYMVLSALKDLEGKPKINSNPVLSETVNPAHVSTRIFQSGTAELPLGPGKLLSHFQIALFQMAHYNLLSNQYTVHPMLIALRYHKHY